MNRSETESTGTLSTVMVPRSSDWAAWLDSYEGLPLPSAPSEAPAAPSPSRPHHWLEVAGLAAPGLVLAGCLALFAQFLAEFIGHTVLGFQKSPIGSIPLAILIAAMLRNTVGVPKVYEAGLKTCVRSLLRLGIVLLGLRLSLPAVGAIGLAGLPLIAVCVTTALLAVAALSRMLGLSAKQGQLIAIGTGICGVSAIAATAPVIDASEDEVSYSIACVTLFGMLAMFTYPFLAFWLFGENHRLAGYLLGTSIHDTAQVTGAAIMYSQQFRAPEALDVATVTKLVRNTTMLVLIPLMGFLSRRGTPASGKGGVRWTAAVPAFVLAYVGLAAIRSLGDLGARPFLLLDRPVWNSLLAGADQSAGWLLGVAMAAVGLGTELSRIRKLGWRPMAAGFGAALVVGGVSVTILKWLPPRF